MTRALMTDLLKQAGFQVTALSGARELADWNRPDICLVELVRQHGNGFSHAASVINRWQPDPPPVVLLSDREQISDIHWAQSRGLAGVINRISGSKAMLQRVRQFVAAQAVPSDAQFHDPQPQCEVEKADQTPVRCLAEQICVSLRSFMNQARQVSSDDIAGQARWLHAAQQGICAISEVLTSFAPSCAPDCASLVHECPRKTLIQLLALYESVSERITGCSDDPYVEPLTRCKAQLHELQARPGDRSLNDMIKMGSGIHALHLPITGAFSDQSVWAWLWQSATMRYFRQFGVAGEWNRLKELIRKSSSACAPVTTEARNVAMSGSGSERGGKLYTALIALCGRPDCGYADIYQLLVWLRLQIEPSEALIVIFGRLAESVNLPGHVPQRILHKQLTTLRNLLETGEWRSEHLAWLLRTSSFSPNPAINNSQQKALVAQLTRLPQPDSCLEFLITEDSKCDLLCSEIRHELAVLSEAANLLQLSDIESIAEVLMQIYSVSAFNPAVLKAPGVHGQLRRGHHGLCLLLDQAAAWQTMSCVGSLTERLYRLLDRLLSLGSSIADQRGVYAHKLQVTKMPPELQSCRQINRRLRQLLTERIQTESARAIMIELLRTQSRLMQQLAAYQDVP